MGVKIPLDFTGVESRGTVRVPEGDYVLKFKEGKKTNAKSSGNPMLVVKFEFASGPKDVLGKSIVDRHILMQDNLWTLRNLLEAMGFKVPAGTMKLDVDKLVGKRVGATVIDDDEYKGKIKSIIADYMPVSAVGNTVRGEDADALSDDDEDDDGFGVFDEDDEDEDVSDDVEEEDDESDDESDDEGFSFDDSDEDDEAEEEEDEGVTLSFGPDDLEPAKGPELKAYVKEAQEAGFDLGLGPKPKVSEVREALAGLFDDDEESDEDDDEMEEFSLDDV